MPVFSCDSGLYFEGLEDSLSVDIATGEYYYDLKERTVDKTAIERGYKAYWEKVISCTNTIF